MFTMCYCELWAHFLGSTSWNISYFNCCCWFELAIRGRAYATTRCLFVLLVYHTPWPQGNGKQDFEVVILWNNWCSLWIDWVWLLIEHCCVYWLHSWYENTIWDLFRNICKHRTLMSSTRSSPYAHGALQGCCQGRCTETLDILRQGLVLSIENIVLSGVF
jgi:hypothetical protein